MIIICASINQNNRDNFHNYIKTNKYKLAIAQDIESKLAHLTYCEHKKKALTLLPYLNKINLLDILKFNIKNIIHY